jgi:hypothetical protein
MHNSFKLALALALVLSAAAQTPPATPFSLFVYYSPKYLDNVVAATAATIASLDATYAPYGTDLAVVSNASAAPGPGYVPLNTYLNPTTRHHMTTASATGNAYALANGFVLQRVEGWVTAVGAQPKTGYSPLTMYYSAARDDHFLVGTPEHAADAQGAGYLVQYIDCFVPRPPANWTLWPSTPAAGAPFPMSTDLLSYEYALGANAVPAGVHADTWYPSWDADNNLYSSWTDGKVNNVTSGSGGYGHAMTGYATIVGDDPFSLVVQNVSTYKEPATPYGGRYPSLNFRKGGVWCVGRARPRATTASTHTPNRKTLSAGITARTRSWTTASSRAPRQTAATGASCAPSRASARRPTTASTGQTRAAT